MVKAVQIKAAFELGKRLFRESAEERKRIGSPDDAIEFVSEYYGPYLKDAKNDKKSFTPHNLHFYISNHNFTNVNLATFHYLNNLATPLI